MADESTSPDFSSIGGKPVYGPPDVTKLSDFSSIGGVDAEAQALRDIPKPQVKMQELEPDEIRQEYGASEPPPGTFTGNIIGVGKAAATAAIDFAKSMGTEEPPAVREYREKVQEPALQPKGVAQQVGASTLNAAATALPIADVPGFIANIPSMYKFAMDALGGSKALDSLVEAAEVGKAFEKPALSPVAQFEPPAQSPESQKILAGLTPAVEGHPAFDPLANEAMRIRGEALPTEAKPVFPLYSQGGSGTVADIRFIKNARAHGVDDETIDQLMTERQAQRDIQKQTAHEQAIGEDVERSVAPAMEENADYEMRKWRGAEEAARYNIAELQQNIRKGREAVDPAHAENIRHEQERWEDAAAAAEYRMQAIRNDRQAQLDQWVQAGKKAEKQVRKIQAAKEMNAMNAELAKTPNAPVFYSKMERVATDKLPNVTSGNAVLSTLKNNGVKQDEIDWADLDNFLKGKDKISKQDVLDYIAGHKIDLKEKVLGEPDPEEYQKMLTQHQDLTQKAGDMLQNLSKSDPEATDALIKYLSGSGDLSKWEALGKFSEANRETAQEYFTTHRELADLSEKIKKGVPQAKTQYGNWVLDREQRPMDEVSEDEKLPLNYREHMFTLQPDAAKAAKAADAKAQYELVTNQLEYTRKRIENDQASAEGGWREKTPEEEAELKALGDKKKRLFEDMTSSGPRYTAPHWPGRDIGQNLLAHARTTDRMLENGDKALMAEEAQSDWLQAAREHRELLAEHADIEKKLGEAQKVYAEAKAKLPNEWDTPQAELDKLNELERDLAEVKRELKETPKPADAPLEKNWHEMVLKRMLRKAAEEGYDRFAWTTGEQQAERYNRALKDIDKITWSPDDSELTFYDKNGNKIGERDAASKRQITQVVGQEMADKLWEKYKSGGMEEGARDSEEWERWERNQELPTLEQVTDEFYQSDESSYSVEPEVDEETGEETGNYVVKDYNGDVVDTFDSERRAERAQERYVQDALDSYLQDAEYRDEDMEEPEGGKPGVSISGDNITLGKSGFQGFYDKIVPNFLKKYVGKWDASIEDMPLQHLDKNGNKQVVHTIKITPKMKKSLLKEPQPIAKKEAPKGVPEPKAYVSAQEALG